MDADGFLSFLPQAVRRHFLPIGLFVLGFILIGVGFLPSFFQSSQKSEVVFEQGSEHDASVAGSMSTLSIQVDVAGAVLKPGVYALSDSSRMQDLIQASGGFTADANQEWIAKNLNLAAKLTDAEKVYIPFQGEVSAENTNQFSSSSFVGEVSAQGNEGQININTASPTELDSLPGVGQATAAKIIAGRPYASVAELLTRKAVGQSVFDKIKDKVRSN